MRARLCFFFVIAFIFSMQGVQAEESTAPLDEQIHNQTSGRLIAMQGTVNPMQAEQIEHVGMLVAVTKEVSIVDKDGGIRKGALKGKVYPGEIIKTAKKSWVQLRFTDGSILKLAPDSEMAVNSYFFNEEKHDAKMEMKTEKATFAFLSGKIGKIAPQNFKLDTATATIGIRGTTVECETGSGYSILGGNGYFFTLPAGNNANPAGDANVSITVPVIPVIAAVPANPAGEDIAINGGDNASNAGSQNSANPADVNNGGPDVINVNGSGVYRVELDANGIPDIKFVLGAPSPYLVVVEEAGGDGAATDKTIIDEESIQASSSEDSAQSTQEADQPAEANQSKDGSQVEGDKNQGDSAATPQNGQNTNASNSQAPVGVEDAKAPPPGGGGPVSGVQSPVVIPAPQMPIVAPGMNLNIDTRAIVQQTINTSDTKKAEEVLVLLATGEVTQEQLDALGLSSLGGVRKGGVIHNIAIANKVDGGNSFILSGQITLASFDASLSNGGTTLEFSFPDNPGLSVFRNGVINQSNQDFSITHHNPQFTIFSKGTNPYIVGFSGNRVGSLPTTGGQGFSSGTTNSEYHPGLGRMVGAFEGAPQTSEPSLKDIGGIASIDGSVQAIRGGLVADWKSRKYLASTSIVRDYFALSSTPSLTGDLSQLDKYRAIMVGNLIGPASTLGKAYHVHSFLQQTVRDPSAFISGSLDVFGTPSGTRVQGVGLVSTAGSDKTLVGMALQGAALTKGTGSANFKGYANNYLTRIAGGKSYFANTLSSNTDFEYSVDYGEGEANGSFFFNTIQYSFGGEGDGSFALNKDIYFIGGMNGFMMSADTSNFGKYIRDTYDVIPDLEDVSMGIFNLKVGDEFLSADRSYYVGRNSTGDTAPTLGVDTTAIYKTFAVGSSEDFTPTTGRNKSLNGVGTVRRVGTEVKSFTYFFDQDQRTLEGLNFVTRGFTGGEFTGSSTSNTYSFGVHNNQARVDGVFEGGFSNDANSLVFSSADRFGTMAVSGIKQVSALAGMGAIVDTESVVTPVDFQARLAGFYMNSAAMVSAPTELKTINFNSVTAGFDQNWIADFGGIRGVLENVSVNSVLTAAILSTDTSTQYLRYTLHRPDNFGNIKNVTNLELQYKKDAVTVSDSVKYAIPRAALRLESSTGVYVFWTAVPPLPADSGGTGSFVSTNLFSGSTSSAPTKFWVVKESVDSGNQKVEEVYVVNPHGSLELMSRAPSSEPSGVAVKTLAEWSGLEGQTSLTNTMTSGVITEISFEYNFWDQGTNSTAYIDRVTFATSDQGKGFTEQFAIEVPTGVEFIDKNAFLMQGTQVRRYLPDVVREHLTGNETLSMISLPNMGLNTSGMLQVMPEEEGFTWGIWKAVTPSELASTTLAMGAFVAGDKLRATTSAMITSLRGGASQIVTYNGGAFGMLLGTGTEWDGLMQVGKFHMEVDFTSAANTGYAQLQSHRINFTNIAISSPAGFAGTAAMTGMTGTVTGDFFNTKVSGNVGEEIAAKALGTFNLSGSRGAQAFGGIMGTRSGTEAIPLTPNVISSPSAITP